MSDTPIAEQLAADLEMPWPLRRSWHINGVLFESPEPGALGSTTGDGGSPNGCGPLWERDRTHPSWMEGPRVADPNCVKCGGTGWREGTVSEQVAHGELGSAVPCGC